jgi:hypothetical protein
MYKIYAVASIQPDSAEICSWCSHFARPPAVEPKSHWRMAVNSKFFLESIRQHRSIFPVRGLLVFLFPDQNRRGFFTLAAAARGASLRSSIGTAVVLETGVSFCRR